MHLVLPIKQISLNLSEKKDFDHCFMIYGTSTIGNISSKFSSNSEANASELLENFVEMFLLYDIIIVIYFACPNLQSHLCGPSRNERLNPKKCEKRYG